MRDRRDVPDLHVVPACAILKFMWLRIDARELASATPLALLTASVVFMTILAWQAAAASRSHRELAQQVLHDYAAFAAVEFVRRSTAIVENYGFAVAMRALLRADTGVDAHAGTNAAAATIPSRAALVAALPANSRDAAELVGTMFAFTEDGSGFHTVDGDLPTEARQALLRVARRPPSTRLEYRVTHPVIDGRMRMLVFSSSLVNTGPVAHHLGFEVPAHALAAWLRKHVTNEPLLPPVLATPDLSRSSISLVVKAPDGSVVFRSPDDETTAAGITPTVTRSMKGETLPGGLNNFSLEVAIAPEAAERLIIGGLPESRSALLLALLGLCAALAFVAALQMRRERRHAHARQDFVTRASHELRTPVARIRVFAETLLLDRVRTPEERDDALQAMDRASRRLSLLIDNVLQFSRQDVGPPSLRIERIELAALTRAAVAEFDASVDAPRGVAVVAPPCIEADIDREAYRQILLNLLDNAWKYGGPARAIRVELVQQDESVSVRVDDQGPGVPERDRERIWQAWVRLDRDDGASIAGTGIGLAVVRDLVTRHKGTCDVQSAPQGGARFVVRFPRSRAHAVEPVRALS